MTQVYLTGAALAGRMVARLLRLRVSRALAGEGFASMISALGLSRRVASSVGCGQQAPGLGRRAESKPGDVSAFHRLLRLPLALSFTRFA